MMSTADGKDIGGAPETPGTAASGATAEVQGAPHAGLEADAGGRKREALGPEAAGAEKKAKLAEGEEGGTAAPERPPIPAEAMGPIGGTPIPVGGPSVTSSGTSSDALPPRPKGPQEQQQQQGGGDKPTIAPGVVQ